MQLKVEKSDKIIIIFYIFLAISVSVFLFNSYLEHDTAPPSLITKNNTMLPDFDDSRVFFYDKQEVFLFFTDIENYPRIISDNIISVKILDTSEDNIIFAEYELIEHGIKVKILAKHTLYPYDKFIIEIMDGDAKGTKITQTFTKVDTRKNMEQDCSQEIECNVLVDCIDCTKIDSKLELKLKGVLQMFKFLPNNNLSHAFNTVLSSFEDYFIFLAENPNEKIVNDLYLEILGRYADTTGLKHWLSLLDNKTMTVSELRTELLNSSEHEFILRSEEFNQTTELSIETREIVDDLYREILGRSVDTDGLEYWGELLQAGEISTSELRKGLLKSEESLALKIHDAKNAKLVIQIFHEVYELNGPYYDQGYLFFDPRIDSSKFQEIKSKYKYLFDVEEITLDEFRFELQQLKDNRVVNFFVNDLDSDDEQFLDWKRAYVDEDYDFCYWCKWGYPGD